MSKAIAVVRPAVSPRWLTPVVAFLAVLAVLALLNREPEADPLAGIGVEPQPRRGCRSTAERVVALQEAIRDDPDSASAYAQLGDAYLQRARETADPSYYDRAENAFAAALATRPRRAHGDRRPGDPCPRPP